jgi:two-component system heavy metal sensor histidine kinase CusS
MPDRRPPSLTLRLAVAYALVALVLMGGSSIVLYRALANAGWRDDAEDVQHATRMVARRMAEKGSVEPRDLEGDAGVRVRVLDPQGRMLLEGPGMSKLAPTSLMPAAPSGLVRIEGPGDTDLLVESVTCRGGVVQAAKDLAHRQRLLVRYREFLALNAGLVALLAALAGWFIARRGLAPLERLARAVAEIRPETLTSRLAATDAPRELQTLTATLNGALGRLEEAFARLGTLNGDMAHELRTPLHALRLDLESLAGTVQDPALGDRLGAATESVDHMGALVEQMLFLARAEDPATVLDRRDLDLDQALAEAARPFESLMEEQGLRLRVQADPASRIQADPTLLRRAIHNLLANAVRHTPRGGEVSLTGFAQEGTTEIQVRDTGEGIPPGQIPQLGQRFARPDASRSRATGGTGLGLAIVQSILRLHGGELSIESVLGQGTTVRMTFPRS